MPGHFELVVVLIIVLLIFGPVLLPWLARRIGLLFTSAKELKESVKHTVEGDDDEDKKDE